MRLTKTVTQFEHADTVSELFDECSESQGLLNEFLIRCALAAAFRRGYESCLV
jgi:hypothetical protein